MTDPEPCTPHRQGRGLTHTFDQLSGWCHHGCGRRDDGHATNRSGSILREALTDPATIPTTYHPALDLDLETTA